MVTRCLGLAHTGKDDDDHVAVVVIVGVVGLERHTVGSCQLAGFGHQPADALVLGAGGAAAVILAVLGQAIDAIHVKHGLVHAVGLVVEVLAHALVAREHRFDDLIGGVIELLVLKLHQDDGNAAFAQGGHIGGGIAARGTQFALGIGHLVGFVCHAQVAALGGDKSFLGSRALLGIVGTHGRESRQRRDVVEVAVSAALDSQAVGGEKGIVKSIAHGLNLQGGAIALGHGVPAWLGGYGKSQCCVAQHRKHNNVLSHRNWFDGVSVKLIIL